MPQSELHGSPHLIQFFCLAVWRSRLKHETGKYTSLIDSKKKEILNIIPFADVLNFYFDVFHLLSDFVLVEEIYFHLLQAALADLVLGNESSNF